MSSATAVLDAMQELILSTGARPSIQQIAQASGLTKQGVLHYFPSRAALDAALVARAVARVDTLMQRAAAEGSAAATYLRLSAPTQADRAVAAVLLSSPDAGVDPEVVRQAFDAVGRWQGLIAEEVGDPILAEIIRLTADGLFSEALALGTSPPAHRVEELVARLCPQDPR